MIYIYEKIKGTGLLLSSFGEESGHLINEMNWPIQWHEAYEFLEPS